MKCFDNQQEEDVVKILMPKIFDNLFFDNQQEDLVVKNFKAENV